MALWRLAYAVLLINALLQRLKYPFSFVIQIPSCCTTLVGLSLDSRSFLFRHLVVVAGKTSSRGVIYYSYYVGTFQRILAQFAILALFVIRA